MTSAGNPTDPATNGSRRLAGTMGLRDVLSGIAEGAFERERDGRPPYDAILLIAQNRLGAVRLPVSEGGAGYSIRQLFELAIDLGAADPDAAQIVRNHYAFVEMWLRARDVPGRDRWLREVASGAIFGMIGTELGPAAVGSRKFGTTLKVKGDGFVLNGVKYYSTGAMFSDWIAVTAAGDDGEVETALVPTDREGIDFEDDWDGMGQQLTGSGTTRLVDVVVHRDEMMSEAVRQASQSTFFQLWLTGIIAGIIGSIVDDAVDVLRRRARTFVHSSAPEPVDDPLLQMTVGEISSASFVARAAVLAAADALEEVGDATLSESDEEEARQVAAFAAAKAKVVVDELGIRAGGMLFDVGGASATRRSVNLDRHWRNIRTLASHNPASYKARAVGDFEINAAPPPPSGFF